MTSNKGKAYANKLTIAKRPLGDFYPTPKSLVWVIKNVIHEEFRDDIVFEPCAGLGSITEVLKEYGYTVIENDLYQTRADCLQHDYLTVKFKYTQIITNPPFSMWDRFVEKAKIECNKVLVIGRLNYFGTNSRLKSNIWSNLKRVYCFNRYIDYRTEYREDGCFHVGAMATAWFLYDSSFIGNPTIHFLDVQQYATLGNKKEG